MTNLSNNLLYKEITSAKVLLPCHLASSQAKALVNVEVLLAMVISSKNSSLSSDLEVAADLNLRGAIALRISDLIEDNRLYAKILCSKIAEPKQIAGGTTSTRQSHHLEIQVYHIDEMPDAPLLSAVSG